MYSGTRKFVTNQRSVPKQTRPSYQQPSIVEKEYNHPYYAQYGSKKQLGKNNSEVDLRQPKQQYFKNLNQRRKNQGQMSNLKSELQNLKNEVNKLISKQTALRTPQKQKPPIRQERSDKKINYVSKAYHDQYTDREEDFSDTASMTSVTTQKVLNQPLRRLQKKNVTQNYEPGYYLQLENQLLKTQIKNLKNKYVSKKRQLTQKCDLLQKKNQYLQITLQKSEESLHQSRRTLQTEIMMIKRQISLKTEIKNQNQPQTDKIDVEGNDLLKQKIKRLYDELSQKNKSVNNLNIQLGDIQAMLQRKKFELKKQSQKNLELSKQIQLTKRENSRLQQMIETQLSKKKDIQKQNQLLKQKNKELITEVYAKEQIVTGSEQYQNRLSEQLEEYKKREDELHLKVSTLKQENKKLKQAVDSDKDEINYLKKNNDDILSRIGQLSRKLKQEQQRVMQRQDYYRRIIEESKRKKQEQIKIIKEQYESQTYNINEQIYKKSQTQSIEVNDILRQKDRQINKWKAEYKILKLKHEQKQTSEQLKKQQIEEYYKGYIEYKHNKQLLEQRNKMLQKSVDNYLNKINEKQTAQMKAQLLHNKEIQELKMQITKLKHQLEQNNDQMNLAKTQLAEYTLKNQQEIKYRQQLQQKIQKFILKQLNGQSSSQQEDGEKQDQTEIHSNEDLTPEEKRNFLEDQEESQQSPKQQQQDIIKKRKANKSKTQKPKPQIQISQSQRLQLQQLSESITAIKKRVIQQDQKLSKNVKQLKNKDTQINKLRKQIRQLLQTHEKQLSQLKQKYTSDKIQMSIKTTLDSEKQVRQLCQKQILIHKQKSTQVLSQNVGMKRKISQIQKQLFDLRQQTKSLSHLYNVKCSQVEQIIEKNQLQLLNRDKKIQQLQILKHHRQNNLLNEISNLKDQIMSLRLQIKNLNSMNNKLQTGNFDEALRTQIENNKKLREQLAKKNEEVFKVRDNYTLVRSQYDNLRSESEIEKLKSISQKKNIEVQYQIQLQNSKNKLNVEEKKVSSLQQKIALVIEENKKKDSFIQSYIMGKKLPQADKQFVVEFVKQYQIILNGKNINDKIRADSHELEKMALYNYRLLKDMAEMKQKMLLYESMEGQALSLYDSKHSSEINRQNDFDSPKSPSKSPTQSPNTPSRKFKKMYSLVNSQVEQRQ